MEASRRLPVASQLDIGRARRQARDLATSLGFSQEDTEVVALAVTELATNLVRYARHGYIVLAAVEGPPGVGIQVESHDDGPGIEDLEQAMQNGYSTRKSMGSGLPSVRRLMDDFEISSSPDGTTIVTRKWPTKR